MSYFLRNFADAYSSNDSIAAAKANRKEECEVARNFVEDNASPSFQNVPFESSHLSEVFDSEEGEESNAFQFDFQSYSGHKQKYRQKYSKLLLLCAKQLHRSGVLYSANADLDAIVMQQEYLQNNMGHKVPLEGQEQWHKCISAGELELDIVLEANKYTSVIAPPSCFGANALAQTTVLRYSNLFNLKNGDCKQQEENDNLEGSSNLNRAAHYFNSPEHNLSQQRHGFQLLTIGLDSIFSVMLELNQRDSELCAQALQSLLQLLQNLPTDTLRNEPRSVVEKMYTLLKRLRVEGNASVSICANACMISLAVAYGHPEFILSTVCALFCDANKNIPFNQLSFECNLLPKNFQNLALSIQQSVQRGTRPSQSEQQLSQWSSLLRSSDFLCDFELVFPSSQSSQSDFYGVGGVLATASGSLVSNGSYVFVLTMYGLLKAGTGLTETKNGEVLASNELLKYSEGSVLLVCNDSLYLRRKHSSRLWVLDVETLREIGEIMLPCLLSEGVLFSDTRNFYHALLDDQWNFTTTLLDDATFTPVPSQKARQSSRLIEIGYTAIGDVNVFQNNLLRSIPPSLQGLIVDIQLSAEIGFILTRHGKVLYAGHATVFNLQATNLAWTELALAEPMVAMTCHSNCLILRSGSGHLWAVGSLTDFFDNQPHSRTPTKKARKIRIPNKRRCTSVASTAGCLGYVTENGRCFFYGRHVVTSQDVVEGLDSIPAASIALGKTHAVVVSKNGILYTFGLNNMNQCGREENPRLALPSPSSPDVANNLRTVLPSSTNSIHSTGSSGVGYCPRNMHLFVKDVASTCLRCGNCSARGDGCPFSTKNYHSAAVRPTAHKFLGTSSTSSPTKLPRGSPCLCGVGESSCLRCGICRCCGDLLSVNQQTSLLIDEKLDEEEDCGNLKQSKSMEEDGLEEANIVEVLEQGAYAVQNSTKYLQKEDLNENMSARKNQEGVREMEINTHTGQIKPSSMVPYRLKAHDTTTMPAGRVILQSNEQSIKVSSVSAGNYHTIVLCADHQVFTFGSNCHGQLGTGDTLRRTGPHRLNLSSNLQVVQAVAGANHCVLRTMEGQVITFGAHKYGQLGRRPASTNDKDWFAEPTILPGYGYAYGKLASWVGAQGDRTIIQCTKQIFSKTDLANCHITANQKVCLIMPANKRVNSRSYVVVRRKGAPNFQHFKLDLADINSVITRSLCLDPRYSSLVWAYDSIRMRVFAYDCENHTDQGSKKQQMEPSYLARHRTFFHITELLLPTEPDVRFSDTQVGIYLLSCLHSMNVCAIAGSLDRSTGGQEELGLGRRKSSTVAPLTNESAGECSMVNRFENYGGGWGYSAHCVEAIQFKTNSDITFCGVGLFGGRGEYVGKLKLFRVIGGAELEEQCVELLGETDEVIYECSPRETAFLHLAKTIPVKANQWHVIWAQIQGPSSDCGAGGQATIRTENVEFQFRSSLLSNNGTDVDVGQIPEIYYRIEKSGNNNGGPKQPCDSQQPRVDNDATDNSPDEKRADPYSLVVQPRNLFSISSDSLSSLYRIFNWAAQGTLSSTNYTEMIQDVENSWKQERSTFVAIIALRMIRLYLGIAYRRSTQRAENNEREGNGAPEQHKTVQSIVEFHRLLMGLFQAADERLLFEDSIGLVLIDEAVEAYVACASLFFPSSEMLYDRLSEMLNTDGLMLAKNQCWYLLALLRVFAKLDTPILTMGSGNENEACKDFFKNNRFIQKLIENFGIIGRQQSTRMTASKLIKFLFQLSFGNIEDFAEERVLPIRLKFAAQKLIAKIARSLVLSGIHTNNGPVLLQTPNRFRKTSTQLSWDVGNNAYDAIAFKVDSAGIKLHGVSVYLSCTVNQQYVYDLEMLVNDGDSLNERWTLVEKASGSVSDRMEALGHHRTANMERSPQIVIIRFSKTINLLPDLCYAVRLLLNGGKTFYGEDGVCSLRLQNNVQLNFVPCSLSENGTTISRGQIPCLLYSIDKLPCINNVGKVVFQQEEVINCPAKLEHESKAGVDSISSNPNHNLFVLILRLLAQKLSMKSVWGKLSPADRKVCSQVVSYANVFVELNPWMAFDVIAAFDEVLPLIANLYADQDEDQEEEQQQKLQKQRHAKKDTSMREYSANKKSFSGSVAQAVVESPHPYRSGQIYSQKASFDKSVEFLYIRFDEECQTLQPDDCLRIFVAASADKDSQESTFYPVGRFSGSKNWPETMLLVPGNCVWFILQSSTTQEECSDASKMYGFRCTIDGICSSAGIKDFNAVLGQEFTWLCANACRLLIQLPSNNHTKQLLLKEQYTREFLRKHGSLLKKGLNIGMPVLKQVLAGQLPQTRESQELKFLKEFIAGDMRTSAGALANVVVSQPFLDLKNSSLDVEQREGRLCVGKIIKLTLLPKDQYNEAVKGPCPVNQSWDVQVVITSGVFDHQTLVENKVEGQDSSAKKALKRLQLAETYRSVYVNKARYLSITMMPVFSNYSFEELRLAFQQASATKANLKLEREEHSDSTGTSYSTQWKPHKPGRYQVQCLVDGFPLQTTKFIDISEIVSPTHSSNFLQKSCHKASRPIVTTTTKAASSTPKSRTNTHRAVCPGISAFKAIRVRSHPTLSAHQIGVLPRGVVFNYTEMVRNGDGVWLKLDSEAKAHYTDHHHHRSQNGQAWCLQFNQHLEVEYLKVSQPSNGNTPLDQAIQPAQRLRSTPKKELVRALGGISSPLRNKQQPSATPVQALVLSPGVVDCCRSVFAAIVWHEKGLLGTLTTAANHLKSQPELQDTIRRVARGFRGRVHQQQHRQLNNSSIPMPLQAVLALWDEVATAVLSVIDRQLIVPSSLNTRRAPSKLHCMDGEEESGVNDNAQDEMCELCEGYFAKPITSHMRTHHAGCGGPSFSHGYNSVGNYTTGWTGTCGEGGHGNAVWYLMCPNCRMNHVKKKGNSLESKVGGNQHEQGYPSNNAKHSTNMILKRNALFLLELKSGDEKSSESAAANRHHGEWTIDMFPQFASPLPQVERPSAQMVMDEETMSSSDEEEGINYNAYKSSPYRYLSHLSDPGVFGMTIESTNMDNVFMNDVSSLSASANLYKRTSTPLKLLPNTYKPSSRNRFAHTIDEYMPSLTNELANSGRGKQVTRIDAMRSSNILRHPVMTFLVENHDLELLRQTFYAGIQRAVSFSYAFRVWNWLLKMVTSESSVSDIVWHHLTAMASYSPLNQWQTTSMSMKFATHLRLLPHPWRLSLLAGDQITERMVADFHAFLTTLAVVLQSPSVDIRLKCLCFRAWTFQLTIHEQSLLITLCNLLATVGAVLSESSESAVVAAFDESGGASGRVNRKISSAESLKALVKQMENVTEVVQVESSSRVQLLPCLTDGSCDTFWESGDEDRNRTRRLSVSWESQACEASLLAVFIDNIRDEGFRVTQITIRSVEKSAPTTSPSRTSIRGLLHNAQVDLSYVGWIQCCVSGTNCVQIILKGDEAGCRLRQLVVFGSKHETITDTNENCRGQTMKPSASHQLLFNTAQMDAFSLFQAISAQAFSDEFAEEQNGTLRQQVLDLLFNRVQLQPLQSYVCFQMVSAVEREVVNLRERGKRNYSYVCGLMVMLVKICECRKGLEVFSLRNGLLIVLSELLLFAPQVVQFQVIETIERLIRHFKPWVFDCAQFVQNIMAVLAKAISLQIKDKIAHKVSSHTLSNHALDIPAYWRMDKQVALEVAHMLMGLMAKIASGSMSDQWSLAFRTEVANNIMQLSSHLMAPSTSTSKLSSDESASRNFSTTIQQLKTAQFWLSVASLAVITDSNWLELCEAWRLLKARQSQEPDSMCENHEDGKTLSHLHCEVCQMDMCRECFSVLHLSKRNKDHKARLIGSAANLCPRVDIHEGCTRLRLNNFLVLFNCAKLSGVVEVGAEAGVLMPQSSHSFGPGECVPTTSSGDPGAKLCVATSGRCRFCANPLKSGYQQLYGVCDYPECIKLSKIACNNVLCCGHWCSGIQGETKCLPCFHCCSSDIRQDADDLCIICFVDRLGEAPCVQLKCGHFFHYNCVQTILEKRWNGPRIVFRFMQCPLCKQQIDHSAFSDLLKPLMDLLEDVSKKAKLRLEYDGLISNAALTSENSTFYNDPVGYAMERYMYVLCSKCHKAYFGGESRCQEELDSSINFNPEELICGGCSDVAGGEICGRHGADYLEYKCRFCCTVAVYFCFGTTHFCSGCHADFPRLMTLSKIQLPKCPAAPKAQQLPDNEPCPLKIQHPPTGEEFSLGCGICRNLHTF